MCGAISNSIEIINVCNSLLVQTSSWSPVNGESLLFQKWFSDENLFPTPKRCSYGWGATASVWIKPSQNHLLRWWRKAGNDELSFVPEETIQSDNFLFVAVVVVCAAVAVVVITVTVSVKWEEIVHLILLYLQGRLLLVGLPSLMIYPKKKRDKVIPVKQNFYLKHAILISSSTQLVSLVAGKGSPRSFCQNAPALRRSSHNEIPWKRYPKDFLFSRCLCVWVRFKNIPARFFFGVFLRPNPNCGDGSSEQHATGHVVQTKLEWKTFICVPKTYQANRFRSGPFRPPEWVFGLN